VADELFFSGTAAEITPIRSVDKIQIGTGRRGEITRRIQEVFFQITSGEREAPGPWLTYVRELKQTQATDTNNGHHKVDIEEPEVTGTKPDVDPMATYRAVATD
jgi:hypothetical protein